MKNIKRVINLVTIFVLALVTTTIVSASSTKVINITNNPAQTGVSMEGHTYSAYRVFDLELTDSDPVGYLYTVSEQFTDFFKDKNGGSVEGLNTVAIEYLEENDVATVAKELREYVVTNKISATATSNVVAKGVESATIAVEELGYYLVLDNGNGDETNAGTVVAAAALGTTDDTLNISLKASGPTIDKEIYHNEDESWGPVGDNQIGDDVEYRLIATVPDTKGYTSYSYQINDSMTEGLTFNDDIVVYVGDELNHHVLSSNFYIVNKISDQEFSLSIDVMEGIARGAFNPGEKLYIYYSATLNENAIVANGSNDNTVDLEYSNNPYDEESKDTTPEVTVRDYTFKLNLLKTNEIHEALKGAEFQIHEGDTPLKFVLSPKEEADGSITHVYTVSKDGDVETLVSPENGKFEIIGLDDDTHYTIYETNAPEGYNAIDPIHFMIKVDYKEDGTIDTMHVTNPVGNDSTGIIVGDTFELGTTIVNTTGSKLPETGGAGTTMFTVVGLGLMVSAVAVVAKKRQANK